MYCSITFKDRKGPQDPKMVKLEMVFYKTGYTHIPRVVNITGAYKHWDNETQSFATSTSEYLRKNQLLLDLKEKYLSVAERWEKEGRNFFVLQWADCFKPKEEEQKKQEAKVLTGRRWGAAAAFHPSSAKRWTRRAKFWASMRR